MSINTKELSPNLWPALEQFFLAENCSGCWCMNHRLKPGVHLEGPPARDALCELVRTSRISGIIAFDDDAPIGWCAFDRMSALPGLDCGYPISAAQTNDVWSIHCISVLKRSSKDVVVEHMVSAAVTAMKQKGAKIVEAYPPPSMPSGNSFSGSIAIYLRQGFNIKGEVNAHYTRMVKVLASEV